MTVLDTIKHGKKADRAVDDIPPLARLFPLGLQHVMAMYAGAVAVPLIAVSYTHLTLPTKRIV